jgi:pimeloyl-ACP methyl ester carboxylesterase
MQKDFLLNTVKNEKLRITSFGIEHINSAPCIIFVHGFKGFKNWGFFPYSGNYFSEKRFFVITFNFSHNGVGQSLTEFDELDRFAKNTFSLEVLELNEIIDAYQNNFFGEKSNSGIGVIGHSRGGAIALLSSAGRKDIDAVTIWSSIAKLDRYTERQKKEWREKKVFEVLNTRTNQLMPLNVSLLEDIENNKNGKLNIENAVRNLNKPLLIIHGEQDLSVPIDEAEQIKEWANPKVTDLFSVPATGHTFDCKHPFDGNNPKFDSVLEKTREFFKTNLN